MLVIYLVVLSGISWLVYLAARDMSNGLSPESSQVGKILFSTLVVVPDHNGVAPHACFYRRSNHLRARAEDL